MRLVEFTGATPFYFYKHVSSASWCKPSVTEPRLEYRKTGKKVLVDLDQVMGIAEVEDDMTVLYLFGGLSSGIYVVKPYNEIKEMLSL